MDIFCHLPISGMDLQILTKYFCKFRELTLKLLAKFIGKKTMTLLRCWIGFLILHIWIR